MSEHRLVLEPSVLRRLGQSMETIAEAWENDIAELRITEEKLAVSERERIRGIDRIADLERDLRDARADNRELIDRNSYLEASVRALFDGSHDAKDALGALATRAVEVFRDAPQVNPRWRDPERKPPGDGDADQPPESFRQSIQITARPDVRLPEMRFTPTIRTAQR